MICFCKFVEIIHNPIMWPRGQSCIKNIQSLCYHGEGQLSYGKAEGFCHLSRTLVALLGRGTFLSPDLPNCSDPSQGPPFFLLQTRNNCDITDPQPRRCEVANVLRITLGRGEITIFTPPISLSGASTLQNKSQCLSPNLV